MAVPIPSASAPRTAWRTGMLAAVITVLVLLLLAAAVSLSIEDERRDNQERLAQSTDQASLAIKTRLAETLRSLQLLAADTRLLDDGPSFAAAAAQLFAGNGAMLRLEHRRSTGELLRFADASVPQAQATAARRETFGTEPGATIRSAAELERPRYSQPYYVQLSDDFGFEIMELAVPLPRSTARPEPRAALVALYAMPLLLDALAPAEFLRTHQVWLAESDGAMIARGAGGLRGRGVYTASGAIDLPGAVLVLRADSLRDRPKLIPNLLTGR